MTIKLTFEIVLPSLPPATPARLAAIFSLGGMICAVTAETYAPC